LPENLVENEMLEKEIIAKYFSLAQLNNLNLVIPAK
jgi:hypothetical protein